MSKKIGEIIKEVFEERGMKLAVFAARLGTVRQNVYKIFQKETIQTEQLGKVGEILNYDFFQHFRQDGRVEWMAAEAEVEYRSTKEELEDCRRKLEDAHKLIESLEARLNDKEHIIKLLEKSLNALSKDGD